MKKSVLILLALLALSTESQAGIFRCRRAAKCAPAARPSCQQGTTPQMQRWAPAATPQAPGCNGTSCPVPTTVAPVTAEDGSPRNLTYPVAYRTTEPAQDQFGFLNWINSVRARVRLPMLRWSDDLAAHAAINSSRGFGHSYMGGTRRQNVGVGALGTVETMWLQSPGHWSAISDPTITEVGLAYVNGVWTMNAR